MLKILLPIFLLTILTGCSKKERWSDVTVLTSGKSITVERQVILAPAGGELSQAFNMSPQTYEISAQDPEGKAKFKWRGENDVAPIFIDFRNSNAYVVGLAVRCGAVVTKLSAPRFPYIFFIGDSNGEWRVVNPNQFPPEFRSANLSESYDSWIEAGEMNPGGQRSPKQIAKQNKAAMYPDNFFQVNFPRSRDEWNYKYKDSTEIQSRYCEPRER